MREIDGRVCCHPVARRTVDGARGWGYVAVVGDGGYAESWKLLKGTRQINMTCFWSDDTTKARMLAGCQQVLDTLKIV